MDKKYSGVLCYKEPCGDLSVYSMYDSAYIGPTFEMMRTCGVEVIDEFRSSDSDDIRIIATNLQKLVEDLNQRPIEYNKKIEFVKECFL